MSEPIRVLMVNYKMQCAGIESFIMNMYRNMDRTKVQFDFLVHYTERQFYDDEIESLGGKIYRLSVREDNNFIKYFKDLKKFFKEHPEYKIVHGHMESFGVFYLRAAKKAGVPIRIAHSHVALRNDGIKGFFKSLLNKGFKKSATHLFACSDIAGRFVFGEKTKFEILNNAIDVEKFIFNEMFRQDIRKEFEIKDEFVIGHVGRFSEEKNHDFLIDIFKEINNEDERAYLFLVGEGILKNKIKQKVNQLGLKEKVVFLGLRKDVNKIFSSIDVFLMPSIFEGLPVSAIEAQTSGVKCVLSDTISKQTQITNNVDFVSLNVSAKDWAKEVIKYKTEYRREDAVFESVREKGFDIKQQSEKLQNFYLTIMTKNKI